MTSKLRMEKLKNLLLYGGKTKNEYLNAETLIIENNHKLWRVASLVSSFIFLVLTIYFRITISNNPTYIENIKMFSYITMSALSLFSMILLDFIFKPESKGSMVVIYILALCVMGYGIFIGNIDKNHPAVTVMVMIIIVPLSIVDRPYRTILLMLASVASEMIVVSIFKEGEILSTDLMNTAMFGLIALIVDTYLQYVRIKGYVNERVLRRLAYVDSLTGLGNELSYIEKRESLDKRIKEKQNVEFAIVMFDVNCVKITNDTLGHIYGCALIVETGRYLRSIFGPSKLFHIGGDEFIAIVVDSDMKNLDDILNKFDEDMKNYTFKKNEVELNLSVARGQAIYDKDTDNNYNDVLNRADKAMYKNKRDMKMKFNLPSR